MGERRKAREFTLQLLFQGDLNDWEINTETLRQFWHETAAAMKVRDFAETTYNGIVTERPKIDDLIERHSNNWRIDRMSRVDRNILRLATYEMLYCNEIPHSVSMNEAIEIGKKYGSGETPAFINGILDNIHKNRQGT